MHGGDLPEALVPFAIYHESGDAKLDALLLPLGRHDVKLGGPAKRGGKNRTMRAGAQQAAGPSGA